MSGANSHSAGQTHELTVLKVFEEFWKMFCGLSPQNVHINIHINIWPFYHYTAQYESSCNIKGKGGEELNKERWVEKRYLYFWDIFELSPTEGNEIMKGELKEIYR